MPDLSSYRILLCLLAIAGCQRNRYEIEMERAGDGVKRKLTLLTQNSAPNDGAETAFPSLEELDRVAREYQAETPRNRAQKFEFIGSFTKHMPADVGIHGSFRNWKTPLGTMSGYVERFRGEDDLSLMIERRKQAANRIVDHLLNWLKAELERESGFNELQRFFDTEFRRDLQNLSLYFFIADFQPQGKAGPAEEPLMRIGQYFVERGYFTPDDLPHFLRGQNLDQDRIAQQIQRFVASKLGIAEDTPRPPALSFLDTPQAMESSLTEYFRQTEAYQELLKEFAQQKRNVSNQPEPLDVFLHLVSISVLPLFEASDQLSVRFKTKERPFLTNGNWDETTAQVTWNRDIQAVNSESFKTSPVFYAFWSIPDIEEQESIFGKIVLRNQALGNYCLWYVGLSPSEAKEWNGFLKNFSSEEELLEQLQSFHFSTESDSDNSHSSYVRDLIQAAIENHGARK